MSCDLSANRADPVELAYDEVAALERPARHHLAVALAIEQGQEVLDVAVEDLERLCVTRRDRPLDGGRVMVGLLPEPQSSMLAKVEPYGFLIIIAMLMTRTLDRVIAPPIDFLLNLYFGLL